MITIIHNCLPAALVRSACAAWPDPSWTGWHRYKGATADKYGSLHASLIPAACKAVIDQLGLVVAETIGDSFIDYDLHAAGLHQIPPGGFLGRHLDAEYHPLRPWRRTHSIVLFLDTFTETQGGELHVEPDTIVRPEFNSVAIFETPGTWHQVFKTSPDSPMRRTIALFGWALSERLDDEKACSARFSHAGTDAGGCGRHCGGTVCNGPKCCRKS